MVYARDKLSKAPQVTVLVRSRLNEINKIDSFVTSLTIDYYC